MSASQQILFWWMLFAASHMLLSSSKPRAALVKRLSTRGFLGVYSLVAIFTFVPIGWIYLNNRHVGELVWNFYGVGWVRNLAITLAALSLTLTLASISQAGPTSLLGQGQSARGLLRITRHPMFLSLGFWGLSHMLLNSFTSDVVFFGGFFVFGVVGCLHQDMRWRKDETMAGFFAETSFFPFLAILTGRTTLPLRELPYKSLAIGLAITYGIYLMHPMMFK